MNERIQKLVEQTKEFMDGSDDLDIFIEKFSDLILEEVMQELFINGYEDAFDFLDEHFGVE
jgi:hypothetical protein